MADTKQEALIKSLVGKTVERVDYLDGYSGITLYFTDGTVLDVGLDNYDSFDVEVSYSDK